MKPVSLLLKRNNEVCSSLPFIALSLSMPAREAAQRNLQMRKGAIGDNQAQVAGYDVLRAGGDQV